MNRLFLLCSILYLLISCQKKSTADASPQVAESLIKYAKGLEIEKYDGFYLMHITSPWPDSDQSFHYVLSESHELLPDSLKRYTFVQIPIQSVIPTSTTHISSIVTLQQIATIKGFPNLDYISSEEVRTRIENKEIVEVADKDEVNFELVLDLNPDVIIAHSIQSNNTKYDQLQKAGIPVVYNGDWVEQTPLGKAEWIKFFGVLYNHYDEAASFFQKVEHEYNTTKALLENIEQKPTVMSGAIFQDIWYAPQGQSWMAHFIKDAQGVYLWENSQGVGSLSLSFETVFETAQHADIWIGPGQYETYKQMQQANNHYTQFDAFKYKKIYSYSIKRGAKGGIVFFEDAPNRPDLILKDFVYILHPNVLVDYQPVFIQALK